MDPNHLADRTDGKYAGQETQPTPGYALHTFSRPADRRRQHDDRIPTQRLARARIGGDLFAGVEGAVAVDLDFPHGASHRRAIEWC